MTAMDQRKVAVLPAVFEDIGKFLGKEVDNDQIVD